MLIKELSFKKHRKQATSFIYKVIQINSINRVIPYSRSRYIYYGVFDEKKLIGVTLIDTEPNKINFDEDIKCLIAKHNVEIYIYCTYVLPEYRNQGIASKLRLYLQSKYNGIITGSCTRSDKAIEHLNYKQGFKLVRNYFNGNIIWMWEKEMGQI